MSDDKARKLVRALIDCYDIVGEYPRKPYEALLAHIEAETARAEAAEREAERLRKELAAETKRADVAIAGKWHAEGERDDAQRERDEAVAALRDVVAWWDEIDRVKSFVALDDGMESRARAILARLGGDADG